MKDKPIGNWLITLAMRAHDPEAIVPKPLFSFQAGYGSTVLLVSVDEGPLREEVGGFDAFRITERKGHVEVITAHKDAKDQWHELVLLEFDLQRDQLSPVEFAKGMVWPSVVRCWENLEADDDYDQEEPFFAACVDFDTDFVIEHSSPELAVAALCDALVNWLQALPRVDDFESLVKPYGVSLVANIAAPKAIDIDALRAAVERHQKTSLHEVLLDVKREQAQTAPASDERGRKLPSVVAVPYATIDSHKSLHSKFTATLAAFESAVRYLASLALAPVPGNNTEERLQELASVLAPRPTLGVYVETVRKRIEGLRTLLPETIGALQSKSGKRSEIGRFVFESLTKMRNDQSAHAGTMPEAAYVDPFEQSRKPLDALLDVLAAETHALPLVVQTELRFPQDDPGDDRYDYKLTKLVGDTVGLPSERTVSRRRLAEGKVYLWQPKIDEFIDMDPLIVYRMCARCQFEEGFFIDHIDPRKPSWLSFRANHRYP